MTNKDGTRKKEILLLAILGVLILVSGVQAYQLSEIRSSVADGSVSAASPSASDAPAPKTSGGSSPQRLQDLPQMVGGC